QMPEIVLDIIAEGPEISHVANKVQPAAMQEHGGEQCQEMRARVLKELAWRERPMFDERIALAKLGKKHRYIGQDKEIGDERCGVMLALVSSDREYHDFSSNAGQKMRGRRRA